MAEKSSSGQASGSTNAAPKDVPKGNPALRMLGLPAWRPRLPSRNWMIFLSIVGSWTAALVYDRRQKKKVQQKWATLVSHISHESLSPTSMPRRVTIFLAPPPGDGIRVTREHFTEYVKPVLNAAALDWDVVEGRREGEVRAGLADRIRRTRQQSGEQVETEFQEDVPAALAKLRGRIGIQEAEGIRGDLVIGRHTWKEYIKGLHEGWLGPMDAPKLPEPALVLDDAAPGSENLEDKLTKAGRKLQDKQASHDRGDVPAIADADLSMTPQSAPVADGNSLDETVLPPENSQLPEEEAKKKEEEEKKKKEEAEKKKPSKPPVTPPYIKPDHYADSHLAPSTPMELTPSEPIPFPHILGMRNTHIRMYRFLTRRYLADEVGRATAAAVLAAHRTYEHQAASETSSPSPWSESENAGAQGGDWEQQHELEEEEKKWLSSVRKRMEKEEGEKVWIGDVVMDSRIAERMRRFELTAADEERARRIGEGTAGIPGEPGQKVGEV